MRSREQPAAMANATYLRASFACHQSDRCCRLLVLLASSSRMRPFASSAPAAGTSVVTINITIVVTFGPNPGAQMMITIIATRMLCILARRGAS